MRTIVAILAMSPALFAAQAQSPAQPGSTPTLQASLTRPAVANARQPVVPAARISADVVLPKLLYMAPYVETISPGTATRPLRTVIVDFTVDAQGRPESVKVLESNAPLANRSVVDSVSHFRYEHCEGGRSSRANAGDAYIQHRAR